MSPLRSYHCTLRGEFGRSIPARSRGQAKVSFFRDVRDAWREARYLDVRATAGPLIEDPDVARNAKYRGVPFARLDMRVRVAERARFGDAFGVIVGVNPAANWNVLFDVSGLTLSCHPNFHIAYFDEAGKVLAEFPAVNGGGK